MARKQPAKVIEKKVIEPIKENIIVGDGSGITLPEIEETKEVLEVQISNVNFSINPSLLEKMLKIGDGAYWNRVLETFVGDMNRRYRR